MKPKLQTVPNLSGDSTTHQQALADGDVHYRSWQYNVADQYKDMTTEEIKESIKKTSNPFAVCFEHWIGDFNLGTGIRNANAFNAKEVFYVGTKKWDRRSAVGVHNYTEVQWISDIEDFKKLKDRYVIVGIDNVPGKSKSINTYKFELNTLFVFGEEGTGLTPGMQSLCKDIVEIPMYGSVRSLNCGTASGIVMHEFVSRFKEA
jgi:tRNA G18 (ribose-2'-O)-methylase SpoU